MKRRLTIMAFLIVGALLLISGLQWHYLHESAHNFLRVLKVNFAVPGSELKTGTEEYYVAGVTGCHLYFGDRSISTQLLQTNLALDSTERIDIDFQSFEVPTALDALVEVDSPFFYVKDAGALRIFLGKTATWEVDSVVDIGAAFTQAVPFRHDLFTQGVFENTMTGEHENVIGKVKLAGTGNALTRINPALLKSEGGGFVGSTGTMRYSASANRLLFAYFYRNEVLEIDTNLQLISRWKTIEESPPIVQVGPRTPVHFDIQVFQGRLFVHSAVRAKNDHVGMFEDHSTIDVYDTATQSYLFSFYLPRQNGQRLGSFRVLNNSVVACYPGVVKRYTINQFD